MLILRDSEDATRDERLAEHILLSANHATPAPPRACAAEPQPWSTDKLRSYFEFVKASFKPKVSEFLPMISAISTYDLGDFYLYDLGDFYLGERAGAARARGVLLAPAAG